MKMYLLILFVCLSLLSCGLFSSCDLSPDDDLAKEPAYTTKIAWDSGFLSNDYRSHIINGDSVFFYGRPPGETTATVFDLVRLNVKTGELIWRSKIKFYNPVLCQPIVTDDYIYVCLDPGTILCFNYVTGEHTATAKLGTIKNQSVRMSYAVTAYQHYLYLGLYGNDGKYFCRLDISGINQSLGPKAEQILVPEVLWEPETKKRVTTKPVIYNNVVYTATHGLGSTPIELAGFDINTKERVFYQTFGGQEDGDVPFPEEGGKNSNILIHNNVLYYLCDSIAAWDLQTKKQLYRHVFGWDTPNQKKYMAAGMREAVFYNNKIYYTNGTGSGPEGFRNIHCIDTKTGKLVWNDVRTFYTLDSNVIIAHDKLYVTQSTGLLVYEPETGKLLGIDKSFVGTDLGRNILYNDYIICIIKDPADLRKGRMAAIYVGE